MAPYYGSNVRFQNHVNHHTGRLTFHGCWHRSVVPEYKWCPMWAMFCILDLSHVTSAAVRNSLTAHRRSSVLRGRQRITLSSQNSPWRPCMDYGWGWLDDETLLMLPNFEVYLWCWSKIRNKKQIIDILWRARWQELVSSEVTSALSWFHCVEQRLRFNQVQNIQDQLTSRWFSSTFPWNAWLNSTSAVLLSHCQATFRWVLSRATGVLRIPWHPIQVRFEGRHPDLLKLEWLSRPF